MPLPASLGCPPGPQRLQLRFWYFGPTRRASGPDPAEQGLLGTTAAARLSISLQMHVPYRAWGDACMRWLRAVPEGCQLEVLQCEVAYLASNMHKISTMQSTRCFLTSWERCRLEVLPRTSHLDPQFAQWCCELVPVGQQRQMLCTD